MEGKGRLYYENGDIYNGEFCEGFRDGNGVMISANGKQVVSKWKRDIEISG